MNDKNENRIDDYLSSHTDEDGKVSVYENKNLKSAKQIMFSDGDFEEYKNTSEITEYKSKRRNTVLKVTVALVLVAAALFFTYRYFTGEREKCENYYATLYGKSGDGADKFEAAKKENSDFYAYISFCDKNYPVVYPENEGITFWQNHLLSGKKNKYGTPYTTAEKNDKSRFVTTAYGNDFSDGAMFSDLREYTKTDYSAQKQTVSLSTESSENVFAIFSAFAYSGDEPFLLDRISFLNDGLKDEYINNLIGESENSFNVDVNNTDCILLLIANGENENVCVAARLLRDGETESNIETRKNKTAAAVASDNSKTVESDSNTADNSAVASKSVSAGETSDYTVSYDLQKPKNQNTEKYEQTGLTANMDKTVKVAVDPVVTMTDLTGLKSKEAQNILKNTLGMQTVEIKYIASDKAKGTVTDQSVAEGAQVTTDVTVELTVSTGIGKNSAIVPELVGNSMSNAETVLKNANLKLGKITEKKSVLEKGTIIDQSVAPNSKVTKNSTVDIFVSDGTDTVKTTNMPSLVGKTKQAAISALKKAGLKAGNVTVSTSSKNAGTVLTQEVPAKAKIEVGSSVNFTVSNGSKINNLTVTNISSWSVTVGGKTYPSGAVIKGSYTDIIPCVVEAEIGSGVGIEAMKAQAVATYCWLYNAGSEKGAAPGVPMKTASSKAIEAAKAVEGKKVYYGSTIAQTYYYAISGGYTANCKDVWYEDIPYLRAVNSSVDKSAYGYETKVTYSSSEIRTLIKNYYGVDLGGVSKDKWFKVTYDENNTYARSINLGGKATVRGTTIRDALNYELRSTAVKIKYNKSSDTFVFTVYGYGHGIGMSQVGAAAYAQKGWSYENILTHYYPGTTVS